MNNKTKVRVKIDTTIWSFDTERFPDSLRLDCPHDSHRVMTVEQAKKLNARLYFLAKEFKLLNAYNKKYDTPKYETKATREVVERKLHTWYTDLWNSKMHKANEPGWCLVDELINLFGVDVVKQAISKLK